MASEANIQKQIELAEEIQILWLERMRDMLKDGTITSTDMSTLRKLLADNGWVLDRSRLPEGLRDKITDRVAFDEDDYGEVSLRVVK